MLKRFVLVLVLIVAGAAAGASQAAAPVQLKNIDNSATLTFPAPDWCAFDVTLTTSGTADVTLWMNDSGLVVREHDTYGGSTVTWSGNGKSFSYPGTSAVGKAPLSYWTDYGSGAVLGGSATVTTSGFGAHVPGFPSEAGRQVITDATVAGFQTVDGVQIPLTLGGTLVAQHGSIHSNDEVVTEICAALS